MDVSIIIPALNEADSIARCISAARAARPAEIIVVDGGSTDDTAAIAAPLADRVDQSASGRAVQMNLGASRASGSVLLFLHADCLLGPECLAQISAALADGRVAGGAFQQRIDAPGLRFRLVERGNDARARWLQLPYGDQAIFVRREIYDQLGGFPEVPLLEDWLFSRSLRRAGRVVLLPGPLKTSARHWLRRGVVRTTLRNWAIIAAARLGVSPARLAEYYRSRGA